MTIAAVNPSTKKAPDSNFDAIDFSVFLSRLNSITEEMTITLEKSSMTSILALCRDFSCCIYDAKNRQIAAVDAIPIQTNSMHLILADIARSLDGDVREGDVIACNDPYHNNTHIGDLVTVCPVFYEGEHVFWAAARGHQLDVGAPVPSSSNPWARDVWQEGLTIPPLKLYEGGKPRRDVIELYLANMRWRQFVEGDLMAQIGSIWTGEKRLQELCKRFGVEKAKSYVERVLKYANERTAAEIRDIPNGTYLAEGWLDGDAVGERFDIPIKCKMTVEDETISVDFAGSGEQVNSGSNVSYAVAQAAGKTPIVMAIDHDIPHNEGCLRQVTVHVPEGSICNATWPHSTARATTEAADLMQDVVWKALAQAVPERVRAGTAHWSNCPMLSGKDAESGEAWGHLLVNGGGGGGATAQSDGWPLIITSASEGGLKTASVEHTELLYPVIFDQWEVEPDSMGLGERMGGPGIRCTIRAVDSSVEMVAMSDALTNPPHGILGGTAGAGGGSFVEDVDGKRRFLPAAFYHSLKASERWTSVSTGGGGYGDPLARPVEMVRQDVRDGFVKAETARAIYGVAVSTDRDPVVEASETNRLREEIAGRRAASPLELYSPTKPNASNWIADTAAEGDEVLSVMRYF